MANSIDYRSDTVTLPTKEMLEAIMNAPLGDDVKNEDPTVNRLQEMAAEMMGKEAALLVTGGTAGNIIAVASHTQKGDEVIMEANAHIFTSEQGGISAIANCMPHGIPGSNGALDPDDVRKAIRDKNNEHHPRTSLICLENTHNGAGGTVITIEQMKAIKEVAEEYDLKVHLDGARIFNAAIALGVEAKEIAAQVDSVTFCLSKGLSCPVGAVLCGTKEFIAKARRVRKVLGGGMRQAGIIAAPGIVALQTMIDRLADDHANARLLAESLVELPYIDLDLSTVQTNIIRFKVKSGAAAFADKLQEKNILVHRVSDTAVRMVTHRHITRDDVLYTIDVLRSLS
jgi:threonine aldolase